ncbi:N-acetylmuramoyl-L-alanine amidase [Neobacillus rhizophilus]|uniref:N-acetylmuramoyl-L-alanine amidase n=1 Tax=Neobacillus rhizophilus TaxID=2833579 RepID=UPI002017498F|nr:N-acetylmuramoyl-L-alanine amidase [Neobacillus rhizophilus]
MKIYLDPGHGGNDPGAQGNGLNEKDVTLDIALKLRSILVNDFENVQVKMSRESDITKSLGSRTSEANSWGADFYLSIHINSAGASAQGYEDYIYNGLSRSSRTARIQSIIHAEVLKVNELIDRGTRQANYHVLRESNMEAVLTENGFISNAHDSALMKQDAWRQKVAQGHANGLAAAFNLVRKNNPAPAPQPSPAPTPAPAPQPAPAPALSNPGSGTLFKVYSGSFKSRENADERVAKLRSMGFDAFVVTTTISSGTWYRVQVGAFANRENAEQRLKVVQIAGFNDSFIIIEGGGGTAASPAGGTSSTTDNSEATDNNTAGNAPSPDVGSVTNEASESAPLGTTDPNIGTSLGSDSETSSGSDTVIETPSPLVQDSSINSIFGPTFLSPEHMNRFVKTVNPSAPDLGSLYLKYGEYYGIRGDIAFAQAVHETNFFRFTGVVKPGQDNFAGIGATGPNNPGASFQTPEEGVIAHLQHLFAYATTNQLPNQYPLVDPRFHLVNRGSAATWTSLNGKWAVPGTTYGQSVLNLYKRMVNFSIQNLDSIQKEIQY